MDTIFITDLRVETRIGVYEWEKHVRQPVLINIEIAMPHSRAGASDDLADALDYDGPRSPISITLRRPQITTQMGGVEFIECHVYDSVDRPAMVVHEEKGHYGVRDVTGSITVHNPHGARTDLGPDAQNVSEDLVKSAN